MTALFSFVDDYITIDRNTFTNCLTACLPDYYMQHLPAASNPTILVFDVNETLLDIEYITPLFKRLFGAGYVMREWFNQLILYSNVLTLSHNYTSFSALGQSILKMLGDIHSVEICDSDIDELGFRMSHMPAHSDVVPALNQLKAAGFRLISLTNSPSSATLGPLINAGIDSFFEKSLSVEKVKKFKPAPEVYRMVVNELGVSPEALCLVAAHAWDTIGSQSVGCRGALVTRGVNATLRTDGAPIPQLQAPDMITLAGKIIAQWGSKSVLTTLLQ